MKWNKLSWVVFLIFSGGVQGRADPQEPAISGEQVKWYTVTLSFEGPRASETDSDPNPFLDYRLQVRFHSPRGTSYDVPGFFDGDGRGGGAGNVWRVHFTPDEAGRWTYEVSFRSGRRVAVESDPEAGSPAGPLQGTRGSFAVAERNPEAPGFLRWGRLEYAGNHYLKFRDGPYWIKAGTDTPENFLAYRGFANTPASHGYEPHIRDWNSGDPDWGDGAGKGIIGALNYLSSRKVNSIYFLPMNIGGDGKDTWPFAGKPQGEGSPSNDNLHNDIQKLSQWEIVFRHAQEKGIVLHFVLNEAETPNKKELDDANLGTERKLFHRELVARFAHHNGIQWNLCEEYDLNLNFGPKRMKAFAGHIQSLDPYDHPITVHNQKPPLESWAPFLGDSRFSVTSLQYHPGPLSYEDLVEEFRKGSKKAGRPIPISVDEFDRTGIADDEWRGKKWPFPSGHSRLRKGILWPVFLSGGQLEFILVSMLETEDFRPYERMWNYNWHARRFLEENVPYWEMEPADEFLAGEAEDYGGGQVFVKTGEVYAVYLPKGDPAGRLDLRSARGTFLKNWYNPREGRFEGSPEKVAGGAWLELGIPPRQPAEDWVLLLKREENSLVPSAGHLKTDRPRVLLRPMKTPHAISLEDLKALPRNKDFKQMLDQLRRDKNAAAQAMVWLLTGERAAADAAVSRMEGYQYPGNVDTFHIYFKLMEFGLAYDWLYHFEGFPAALKAIVRDRILPLAKKAIRITDDHIFHNYIWMSAGGLALWALATAGEDGESDKLFEQIRQRFNQRLYPAWEYLDGLPSEPMGYWALYVWSPGILALLGAQSAFEMNLTGAVQKEHGDFLNRHFENLIHSTLPDRRYIPWGDLQSGPNGGVTHEMAGVIDGLTWALQSPQGAYFSRWIAKNRGLRRFYGETAMFYMLYTNHLKAEPALPPLSFLAGNKNGGHFIARSGWDDGATVVSLTSTDHYGDHHHYDQGSFVIYRNGLLAVDPPVYRRIRGPQQKTENHNTLLIGGNSQRPARGQWFNTLEKFKENLTGGRRLETGDLLFYKEAGEWAAASVQFAQAYEPGLVQSCVRQLLFVRPGTVVVVDQLRSPESRELPEVEWLLQVPREPLLDGPNLVTSNGKSWLRLRPLFPGDPSNPAVTQTDVRTHRVSFKYREREALTLVHMLDVGNGEKPGPAAGAEVKPADRGIQVTLKGSSFLFSSRESFEVQPRD